jgi:hypothetical protein
MSGGLHWKEDNRVAGDIVTPPDSVFPFTVECKKREGWQLDQVLKGTGEVEDWWEQCIGDSERVSLRPFLVFSKNFAPNFVMMLSEDLNQILIRAHERSGDRTDFSYFIFHKSHGGNRVIFLLDDLVKWVQKEDVIKAFDL